jgi:myo-inositol-1(or 4)-monophosphatase
LQFDDAQQSQEIEEAAAQLARGAGEVLAGYFGRQMTVEYKGKGQQDPVTSADRASQEYLVAEITRRFPGHGILAEESAGESADESEVAPSDFLWVLDPLDGTTNFLNGLPVYAVSIGVLYRGWPLAGAIYVPWPKPGGGLVLHCHRGGGCFADGKPVTVFESEAPGAGRLVGLPGSFAHTTRFSRKLRAPAGEMRITGSIAYELAMTACGVLQYAIIGGPRIWDMAAGALAVLEANGAVVARLPGEKRWRHLESLVPAWEVKPPTLKELRGWVAPLVAGNRQVAPLIAHNLRPRSRLSARLRRLRRLLRPVK